MKSALKAREKRISDRRVVVGLLPGKVLYAGDVIHAKLADISPHGLGLIIDRFIAAGESMDLAMPDSKLTFKIAWIKADFGKNDLWRVGLMCTDPRVDVEALFREKNCLK